MVASDLDRELDVERQAVEKELRLVLRDEKRIPQRLRQAIRHSLLAGGKRLRPILLLWTWDAVTAYGGPPMVSRQEALRAACGLEMLHTYSLIHDDLPAMDDDDLRRGAPTCHVAFDEATAILAGDALQAAAFEFTARAPQTDSRWPAFMVWVVELPRGVNGAIRPESRWVSVKVNPGGSCRS